MLDALKGNITQTKYHRYLFSLNELSKFLYASALVHIKDHVVWTCDDPEIKNDLLLFKTLDYWSRELPGVKQTNIANHAIAIFS